MTPTRLTAALTLLTALTAAARADVFVPVADPTGDNTGLLDVTSVSAAASGGTLTFRVDFAGPISNPALGGGTYDVFDFIDIDADRSAATPATPLDPLSRGNVDPFAPGVDFYVNLQVLLTAGNPGNQAEVIDVATGSVAGQATITFGPTWYEVAVPLGLLGPLTADGLVNYGVIARDGNGDVSDYAPDGGVFALSQVLPAATEIPEPGTVLLLAASGLTLLGLRRVRRGDRPTQRTCP